MLTINGLTVRLGGRAILDRASASLPAKSRTGLIGRNGAGKSTLMKAMIGSLEADEGGIEMPRKTRIGYIAQEAPSGSATPFETVLAADTARAELLHQSETVTDPERLGDIHERLIAIDAYTAPARAARILIGLGFDEDMQGQPLDSFSGGWKMRVALAALLFSSPDLLLLDEPSNHLDLEATMWLESFLRAYPGQLVVISHERDLLNKVVDHILHLEGGKVTLYPGGYDAFERQRAERAAQLAAAKAAQDAQRAKLADYIARNSARAATPSRAKSGPIFQPATHRRRKPHPANSAPTRTTRATESGIASHRRKNPSRGQGNTRSSKANTSAKSPERNGCATKPPASGRLPPRHSQRKLRYANSNPHVR